VSIALLPSNAALFLGQTQQFSALVIGTTNTAVNWSVNGIAGGNSTGGTISGAGLYAAPRVLTASATVTVTATSDADPSKSASANVTLKSDVVVNISPNSASLTTGASQTFNASVTGSGNPDLSVTWSVNGVAGGNTTAGTISSTGPDSAMYTAPAAPPSPPTVSATATSVADPSRSASASVTIQCGNSSAVLPATASVALGQSQIFTATLCVPPGTQITWDVNGIVGGNATLGTVTNNGSAMATYTAPSSSPAANPVTLRATSQTSPPQSATANITIVSNVTVTVAPGSASVPVSQRALFTATVANSSNTAVTWTVNGIPDGNPTVGQICVPASNPCAPPGPISGSVDYLAPATIPAPNPVTLTAKSQADPTRSGSAQATIATPSPASVSIAPAYAFVAPAGQAGSSQQFTAAVSGSSNTAVAWSVATAIPGQGGSACGTIDNDGLYTAPASAPSPNAISVTATSQADPSKSASATVAITSGPTIERLLPSSVIAGAANSFTLAVQGQGFATGSSGSVILLGGNPRATACASAIQCTTTLQPADVSAGVVRTVQVQNPGSPGPLSNIVSFVVVQPGSGEDVIPLSTAQPAASGKDILVAEPTTAGATSAQMNVDFIGFVTGGNTCNAQGSPVFVTRPASGSATVSLCVHGNGLDPSFTYVFSGPPANDITVSAVSLSGFFPNLIQLNVVLSSSTLAGPRTLFITTPNNDTAAVTGMLEVK
jgi:hypothetical protein